MTCGSGAQWTQGRHINASRSGELATTTDTPACVYDASIMHWSKETGVVDFTQPSKVYENVKQATSFGMRSEVYVPGIKVDTNAQDVPSSDASQIANNLSNLGQNCNREDISTGDWQRDKMLKKIEFECTA
ncbi:Dihydrodipicolinate reductase-like protein CRR1, chloroplastic, partial [Cucurbita argyrosperma subsp. sororia]